MYENKERKTERHTMADLEKSLSEGPPLLLFLLFLPLSVSVSLPLVCVLLLSVFVLICCVVVVDSGSGDQEQSPSSPSPGSASPRTPRSASGKGRTTPSGRRAKATVYTVQNPMLAGLADQQPAQAQQAQDAGSGTGIELADVSGSAADGSGERKMPAKGSAMVQAGALPRGAPGHQRSPTEAQRTLKAAERLAKLKARLDGPDEPVTPGSQSWDGDAADEQRQTETEVEAAAEIDASAAAMAPPPAVGIAPPSMSQPHDQAEAQPAAEHETDAGDDE